MLRIRLFQPFPAEQIIAALPPTVRSIAVLDRTKEPGAVGEPLYLEVVAALAEAMDGDDPPFATAPRVIGGRYGLSSKEMTPVDDQADLRGARRRRGRSATSRSASTTTSPTSACRSTATFRRPAPGRRGPGRLLRPRLGRHGRRQQGVGQDHRREHRPVRPGLLRLRLQEVGLGHGVAPALRAASPSARPISSRTPTSSPATSSGCSARPRSSSPPSTARRSCSTPRTGPTRSGITCPATSSSMLIDKEIDFWVIDALAVADEAGMGSRINTVMQPCFFQLAGHPAARRGDRPDQGASSRRPTPSAARPSSRATSPPSTARSSASAHVTLGGVTERRSRRPRRCPTTCPTSSPGSRRD